MLFLKSEQIMENSTKFQGAKVWNDISDDLKLLPLKMFKKNLKLILVEKY